MIITRSPATKAPIEVGLFAFVTERYRALGIAADPMELFQQATDLRARIVNHRSRAKTALPVALILLIVALGGLINAIGSPSVDLAVVAVATILASIS